MSKPDRNNKTTQRRFQMRNSKSNWAHLMLQFIQSQKVNRPSGGKPDSFFSLYPSI